MVSEINKPSAWKIVQLVKALPHEHEDLGHSPRIYKKLSESPCNSRDGEMEVETGRSLGLSGQPA